MEKVNVTKDQVLNWLGSDDTLNEALALFSGQLIMNIQANH